MGFITAKGQQSSDLALATKEKEKKRRKGQRCCCSFCYKGNTLFANELKRERLRRSWCVKTVCLAPSRTVCRSFEAGDWLIDWLTDDDESEEDEGRGTSLRQHEPEQSIRWSAAKDKDVWGVNHMLLLIRLGRKRDRSIAFEFGASFFGTSLLVLYGLNSFLACFFSSLHSLLGREFRTISIVNLNS